MDTINRVEGLPIELSDALADVLADVFQDAKPTDFHHEASGFVLDLTKRGYIVQPTSVEGGFEDIDMPELGGVLRERYADAKPEADWAWEADALSRGLSERGYGIVKGR